MSYAPLAAHALLVLGLGDRQGSPFSAQSCLHGDEGQPPSTEQREKRGKTRTTMNHMAEVLPLPLSPQPTHNTYFRERNHVSRQD